MAKMSQMFERAISNSLTQLTKTAKQALMARFSQNVQNRQTSRSGQNGQKNQRENEKKNKNVRNGQHGQKGQKVKVDQNIKKYDADATLRKNSKVLKMDKMARRPERPGLPEWLH